MKKIKISENQAKRLGLIKETNDDGGLKSFNQVLGPTYIKIVIEGPSVAKNKDFILNRGKRIDETNTLAFFEATGKIVGNFDSKKVKELSKELVRFDSTISITNKISGRTIKETNKLKITKEQYNRIFATKLYETMNSVDKTFKSEFNGGNIKNLGESNFDIKKPNTSIPRNAQGTFGKDMLQENLKNETLELIKYLYRKSDKLSPFWDENGVSYDDICDVLTSKGLIIKKDGAYQVSKKAGSREEVISAIESTLNELIGETDGKKLETESGDYPWGASQDPRAPYNQPKQNFSTPNKPKQNKLNVLAYNKEVAILNADGELFTFYYYDLDRSDFMPYASVERRYVGRDEDGAPEYEYDEDFEIDGDVISNYVNDNISRLKVGEGIEGWESGYDLVKIDEPLKQELIDIYGLNKNIVTALTPINEESEKPEEPSGAEMLKKSIGGYLQKPSITKSKEEIAASLKAIRDKELERRKGEKFSEEIVDETTSASSSGQYTANAFPNIDRNGVFKNKKIKESFSKAETTPQWAGGSFVEQPDCSKMDNNKEAQNGGCNSGASSLKLKQKNGSINAPSLGKSPIRK